MRCLALDLGRKHTGVAFFDERTGVPVPLETFHHADEVELVERMVILASERAVDAFVIGLPFLPGGAEGEQARFVREIAKKLCEACPWCELHFIDERWTSRGSGIRNRELGIRNDKHAQDALIVLQTFLARLKGQDS